MTDRIALTMLLVTAAFVYAASTAGVVCSNDGAHFATARSIVRNGTFGLGDGVAFAQNDVCRDVEGRLHANRPVGTALLLTPAYAVGYWIPIEWLGQPSAPEDRWINDVEFASSKKLGYSFDKGEFLKLYHAERVTQWTCSLTACLFGTASVALTWRLARSLGISTTAALLAAMSLAFGTIHWRYSTACFSHVFSQTLLLWNVVWLVDGRATQSVGRAALFGLVAGLGVLVEYQALFTFPVLAVWFFCGLPVERRLRVRMILGALAGIAIFGLAILIDHWRRFGGPLTTPMATSVYFEYTGRFSTMFGSNPFRGAYTLYFSRFTNGLCWTSWCAALAGIGWVGLIFEKTLGTKRQSTSAKSPAAVIRRRQWLAIATIVAIHSGLMFFIEVPYGGATADHRYLVRVLPLILLPLGSVVDCFLLAVSGMSPVRRRAAIGLLIAVGLTIAFHDIGKMIELQANFMKHKTWLPATWIDFQHPPASTFIELLRAAFPR